MEQNIKTVGITADGLVVLRNSDEAKSLSIIDPYANFFINDDGYNLVQMAKSVDGVYGEFNLARFKYTTMRLSSLAKNYEQLVLPGAGLDCRALFLDELKNTDIQIYELDTPFKLHWKEETLLKHNVKIPDNVHYVKANLSDENAVTLLFNAGFNPQKSKLILMEGLVFYLDSKTCMELLNPETLSLKSMDKIIFDFWNNERVETLNSRVRSKINVELFKKFPLSNTPEGLITDLINLGYKDIEVKKLQEITREYYNKEITDEFSDSWFIVEAAAAK